MPRHVGFALFVKDHGHHRVGRDYALDSKVRVEWAWAAVLDSPAVKRGSIIPLTVDVRAGTVNGSKEGPYAELLSKAALDAAQLLPQLAKAWDPDAPDTLKGNVAAKVGALWQLRDVQRKELPTIDGADSEDEEMRNLPVPQACALPMVDSVGSQRAAEAMLVAATFAADLSSREQVPVVVVGRPPGHHATCAHRLGIGSPSFSSPGGLLRGASLGGGCFYPSIWFAAVHSLRNGLADRLAYIDVDAHKPDGVWKEMDNLCRLGRKQRSAVLGRHADACQGVTFASVHVDGYPHPKIDKTGWSSVASVIPKGAKRSFEVRVLEELLPKGMKDDSAMKLKNSDVLKAYNRWADAVSRDLSSFKPNGIFVGLGFDLHQAEKELNDKRAGLGIIARHYKKLFSSLSASNATGPVVLTMEGGYTKAGVVDGMQGTLAGLQQLGRSMRRQRGAMKAAPRGLRAVAKKGNCSSKTRHMPTSAPTNLISAKRMLWPKVAMGVAKQRKSTK